jgi:hypothetical protein
MDSIYNVTLKSGLSYTSDALCVKDFVLSAKAFFESQDDNEEVLELERGEAVIHMINEFGEEGAQIHWSLKANSYQDPNAS